MSYQFNYFLSKTGLLHKRAAAPAGGETLCGIAVSDLLDDYLYRVAEDGWAEGWLAENPHDLCRNCKAQAHA